MKTLNKILKFKILLIAKVLFYLFFKTGYYQHWSNLYRFLFEKRFKDIELPTVKSLNDLGWMLSVNAIKWASDGVLELFDACSYPGKAWQVFLGFETPKHGFDCDDFASFSIAVINKSIEQGEKLNCTEANLLTVYWLNGLMPNGHNVALITSLDTSGDKVKQVYSYMDYNVPSEKVETIQEVADMVRASYGPGSTPVGHAVSRPDLKNVFVKLE